MYRIIFPNVSECNRLSGKTITMKRFHYEPFILYKPPLTIPKPTSTDYNSLRTSRSKGRKPDTDMKQNSARKDLSNLKKTLTTPTQKKEAPKKEQPSSKKESIISRQDLVVTPPAKRVKRQKFTKPVVVEDTDTTEESEDAEEINAKPIRDSIYDDDYVIDKVYKKREVLGKAQYLVRFKGEKRDIKAWVLDSYISNIIDGGDKNEPSESQSLHGVQLANFPKIDSISGAIQVKNQLMVSVKWKDTDIESLVPSSLIKEIQPHKLIEFYERNLVFESKKDDQDRM